MLSQIRNTHGKKGGWEVAGDQWCGIASRE